MVYMLPSDVEDRRWDVPRECNDGTFRAPVFHNIYKVISAWFGNALPESGLANKRWDVKTRAFTNSYANTTKSFTGAVFIRTVGSEAAWNCRSTAQKMDSIKDNLKVAGLTNPGFNYFVLLIAQQGQSSCAAQQNGAAGSGHFDRATAGLDAEGRPTAVGFGLRRGYNTATSTYYNLAYACSDAYGPTVVVHEIAHVLGAVPEVTDGAEDGDTADPNFHHVPANQTGDAMHASAGRPLTNKQSSSGPGEAAYLNYDIGDNNYRTETVTNRSGYWVNGYSDPDDSYRYC